MAAGFLKYGAWWSNKWNPLAIELACIKEMGKWRNKRLEPCGKGLAFHVMEAIRLMWPDTYWHRWNEKMIFPELCKPGRLAIFGPSSTGKSLCFSQFALTMFYARPQGTTVIISSTTLDALKSRIWGYVTSFDKTARRKYPWLPGSMIESSQKLLADPSTEDGRSYTNGVMGVALKKGGTWQGLSELVGRKNEVMILGCDELQFCPISVIDSLANLESNDLCFSAFMGNLPDVHNSLARAAEPKGGWESLPDTERSRVYETKWFNGRAIQLIGTDSPNLEFPEGQEPYKNLIGRRYIEQQAHNLGRETDKFNMFVSGKIPRASMNRTIFTKGQCIKFNAMDQVTWGHEPLIRGYGIDAAYSGVGGDRTIGFPFAFGKDNRGQNKLWFGRMTTFLGSDTPKMTHAEAIVHQCKQECDAAGIPPEHVFYDGTGRSELTIAFARLWSSQVIPLEFGGPATDRPSFTGEKHFHGELLGEVKTCREAFDRFVSELWFAASYCITSDQMRGLNEEAIEEGCQRKWELVRGAKQCVETKDDMKERGLRSPDVFDAVVVSCEGARRLGFPLGKTGTVKKTSYAWLESQRDAEWERLEKETLAA